MAARHGLEMEDALELANKLHVNVNISSPEHKSIQEQLPRLPGSCWESAERLLKDRSIYERDGVFSPLVIDSSVTTLKGYDDKDFSEKYYSKGDEIKKLVDKYLHLG